VVDASRRAGKQAELVASTAAQKTAKGVQNIANKASEGAHQAADNAAKVAAGATVDMLQALKNDVSKADDEKQHKHFEQADARLQATNRPRWGLGTRRLAPPFPTKYDPKAYEESAEENLGSRLDNMLSIKTKELAQAERELVFLKQKLVEAQERHDICMNLYKGIKNECDGIKKKKTHLRVFGRDKAKAESSPKKMKHGT